MRHLALLLVMLVAYIFSTTIQESPTTPPTAAAATGYFLPASEYELESLIKREHLHHCGRAIYRSIVLKAVSRWRSKDMVARNYFSHAIPPAGYRVWHYFRSFGIRGWTGGGEDLAWNNYPTTTGHNDSTAQGAFYNLMASPGHRALIQQCDYDRLSVGAYHTTNKTVFTVEFVDYD